MRLYVHFIIFYMYLSTVLSMQNGTLNRTDEFSDEIGATVKQSRSRKAVNGSRQMVPRTRSTPKDRSDEIPQIHHDKEYRLPAVRQGWNGSTKNDKHCNCRCHAERDYLYNLLRKVLGGKSEEAGKEEITFDEALQNADGWLLRLAKSRLTKVKDKLEEAKQKYNEVFDDVNRSADDVAGEIERLDKKLSKRLDELGEAPVKSDEYQAPEEFIRKEFVRHITTSTTQKQDEPRVYKNIPNRIRLSS